MNLSPETESLRDDLLALRRDFHQHPELGFQETRTAGIVAERLRSLGLSVTTGVAKTGVIGLLGDASGRAILLRADMDALPLTEENEVEYASQHPGVMHACGHDGHTAILLTVAKLLSRVPPPEGVCYKLVFQPAEEGGGGASVMINEGALRDPEVVVALAAHLWNDLPVGKVGVRAGPVLASADHFVVTLTGKGGHGAMPHQTRDPIVVAAELILAWQTIVSRNVNPVDSAALTIGAVDAGTVANIIPDRARLRGTLRALSPATRQMVIRRVETILKGVTAAHELTYDFSFTTGYPPTVNAAEPTEVVRRAAAEVVGADNVVEQDLVMGAEDMSLFLQQVAGCFFVIGSRNEEKGLTAPHHNARFDFDEDALLVGAETMVRVARKLAAQLVQDGVG
jgi:amidohydrolase